MRQQQQQPRRRVGVLGMGKLGESLAAGLRMRHGNGADAVHIEGTTRTHESAEEVSKRLGVHVHTDNAALTSSSDILLLCVKPHQAESVLREVAPRITERHLVISVVASITSTQIAESLGRGKAAIIRAMPNTPCLVGEGMTVFAKGPRAESKHVSEAERIFSAVGRTAVVEEHLMDGVTGLSGCGPAYIYLVIEALSEAGVKVGLPRQTATLLAAQTLLGSARMVLERGQHPAALKDEVTTPAGCTIDGLMVLEDGKLRATLIKAVLAATKRSKGLRDAR